MSNYRSMNIIIVAIAKTALLLCLCFSTICMFWGSVMAQSRTIYISDHFDDQADWVGYDGDCIDPPFPWDSYGDFCSERIRIDSTDDAHGSGKCLWIEWAQGMQELGLLCPCDVYGGKQTVWIGFWWRHNSGWDWGGDVTHKWFYGPEAGGDRMMINFDTNHRAFWDGNTQLSSNIPFDTSDSTWHSVIIKLKHNTGSNYDGEIRMWWDTVEAEWTMLDGGFSSNLELRFDSEASTWDYALNSAFGYQSRPDWGSGNISYFDDIVVAGNQADVEDFLSIPGPDITPENLIVSVYQDIVRISWDEVPGCTYNVYSATNPYAPFNIWTQIATGIVDTYFEEPLSGTCKFYMVTAVM